MAVASEQLYPAEPRAGWRPWLPALHLATWVGFSWLPLSYYRMVGWPWIMVWPLGWLALLGWTVGHLRQWRQPFYRLGHGLDGWMGAAAIALALSTLRSPFGRVAVWNASLAVSYGLGLYAYRNWVDRGGLTRQQLWGGLVAVAAGVAVISLALWRPDRAMWDGQNVLMALRNHQPLGHHNFVGGYLVLTLPLAVAAAIATQGWWRLLTALASGLIGVSLYVSGSRGAALGLLVWLLATWLGRFWRAQGRHRWGWGLVGLVGLALVGLALVSNPRIRGWLGSARAMLLDASTLDRWFMLRLGGHILRDRPLVGVGPGVMSRVSNLYRPIETGAGLDHIQQLHNTPVQLAGELGLPGLLLYLVGLGLVVRLGWQLWRSPLGSGDRALVGGLGGGLLAYGVSSLTDYQLENIPIAGTLLLMVVLLLSVADAAGWPVVAVAASARRGMSLALWVWLGLLVYLWLPFILTVGFGALADGAFYSQQLNLADSRWYKATRLSPWDPTAGAVASEALLGLDQVLAESEAKDNVRSLLLDYAHQAQRAAPNDVWFNQNLAVLLQGEAPDQALPYAVRAVQLMPRNRNYGYWLLGELLLTAEQREPAIAAFTLEALVNPEALTHPTWQMAPLQTLYPAVVERTLAEYDHLLAQLSPEEVGYAPLAETRILLQWWTGRPLPEPTISLRPISQALRLADQNPQTALAMVETALASDPANQPLRLLAAWLNPSKHWPAYRDAIATGPTADLILVENSLTSRPLRAWLTSLRRPPEPAYRGALSFAYRNEQANQITLMLQPDRLQVYSLISKLELFQPWPREFPALDHRLEALRTEALGLPHPTHHGFRLSTLSLQPPP